VYEVLILLVLVNLGFTAYIWQTVRRGPERKFLGKLLNGKPIMPNHTPSSLRNGIELRITDEDRRFFSDFKMFADALNHRFEPNEPWRLQERSDAELTGREEPEYGRTRFSIMNIALETCRFLRASTTALLIHRSEPKSSCSTLDCCRLAKSTGSFLLLLISRHQEIQKKLRGKKYDS
jgi:hypothetical protein